MGPFQGHLGRVPKSHLIYFWSLISIRPVYTSTLVPYSHAPLYECDYTSLQLTLGLRGAADQTVPSREPCAIPTPFDPQV